MNTASRLKLCNRSLGFVLLLTLASAIQLEATSGIYTWSVWVHIVLGLLLTILACRHIYLHYRRSNWFARFASNRNAVTRVLWWLFLLTAVSGLIATGIWLDGNEHSYLGAVHGKIGFLMVIAAIIHLARNIRKKKRASRYSPAIPPGRSTESGSRRPLR